MVVLIIIIFILIPLLICTAAHFRALLEYIIENLVIQALNLAWHHNIHLFLVHVLVLGRERWRSLLLSYGGLFATSSCRAARLFDLTELSSDSIIICRTGNEVILVAILFVVILSFLTVFDRGDARSWSFLLFLLTNCAVCRPPLHRLSL